MRPLLFSKRSKGKPITTIAVNKTSIACDLQATHSSGFKFKVKTKLFEFDNKLLYPLKFTVGYCGQLDEIPDVLEYLADSSGITKIPRKGRSTEFVVLTEDHKIYIFYSPNKWILVDGPCYAIGSGMHYALGAMQSGATTIEAIKAASKLDPHSGLGYKYLEYK